MTIFWWGFVSGLFVALLVWIGILLWDIKKINTQQMNSVSDVSIKDAVSGLTPDELNALVAKDISSGGSIKSD